jgi:hypothetical protein
MKKLARTLLSSAALGALATAPAMADNGPAFHLFALHDGRLVSKTVRHQPGSPGMTESAPVYTTIPASDLHKKVKLTNTYYTWGNSYDVCQPPKHKQKVVLSTNKTPYAKLGTATDTYSFGYPSGPTTLYGDTYKLTNPDGIGQSDSFISTLYGTFWAYGHKYKGAATLIVTVDIKK